SLLVPARDGSHLAKRRTSASGEKRRRTLTGKELMSIDLRLKVRSFCFGSQASAGRSRERSSVPPKPPGVGPLHARADGFAGPRSACRRRRPCSRVCGTTENCLRVAGVGGVR